MSILPLAWGNHGDTGTSALLNQPRTVRSGLFAGHLRALYSKSRLRSSFLQLDELRSDGEGSEIIAHGHRASQWQKNLIIQSCLVQKLANTAWGQNVCITHYSHFCFLEANECLVEWTPSCLLSLLLPSTRLY